MDENVWFSSSIVVINLDEFTSSFFLCVGGLGEAVCAALSEETGVKVRRLAVTGIPRSGPGSVLMDIYGISANHIVKAVKELLA